MGKTVILARVVDQCLQLTNVPLLASGGIDEVQVHFTFCHLWTGLTKTAVFYRPGGDVFHILIDGGAATVPAEVMEASGEFFIGVFAPDGTGRRTTQVQALTVEQGAITEATAVPDPTPDIYSQLIRMIEEAHIVPDETLSKTGYAADAGAVGTRFEQERARTEEDISAAIKNHKEGHIQLIRGVHYGTDEEIPADLPEGGLFFKVVE